MQEIPPGEVRTATSLDAERPLTGLVKVTNRAVIGTCGRHVTVVVASARQLSLAHERLPSITARECSVKCSTIASSTSSTMATYVRGGPVSWAHTTSID